MIKLFVVHSILESSENVKSGMRAEIDLFTSCNEINSYEIVNEPNKPDAETSGTGDKESGIIILTATGGTEEIINKLVTSTNAPVLLFAVSRKNSLAASLEAYSYLKNSYPVKLYVSENTEKDINAINRFVNVCKTIKRINSSRFGLVGEPSDWLLSSKNIKSFGNFDTSLIQLSTKSIVDKVSKVSEDETKNTFNQIKSIYPKSTVDDGSVRESGKVFHAMNQVISENKLDSISIRCFDLLEHKYTACMGMSMCNDNGIVSGCEGDIPATFTMMIGAYLTGQPCWMANPAVIDKSKNEITFAHCTVPSKMLKDNSEMNLTTHMESGLSTANQGKLYESDVTVLRINSKFDKLLVTTGVIVESDMREPSLCRTQARIKINAAIENWIENSVGNHQIILYGNITEELKDFCKFTGVQLILL